MISFKQYLTEARLAPLYHATSLANAKEILQTNLMKTGWLSEPDIDKKTVSLTRNFTFALNWINERGFNHGIIFELDQQKLTHNYKIIPYNYFGTKGFGDYVKGSRNTPIHVTNSKGKDFAFENQHEEAVIGPIKNFKKYITKIYMSDDSSISDEFRELNVPILSYKTKKRLNNK